MEYSIVDAFASKPFEGNPAAVFVMDAYPPDRTMQLIAREMNLSETSFVVPEKGKPGHFRLRWLTPSTEVDLCGHATLAAAKAVFEAGLGSDPEGIVFHTRSGPLSVSLDSQNPALICLNFPSEPPSPSTSDSSLLFSSVRILWSQPQTHIDEKF